MKHIVAVASKIWHNLILTFNTLSGHLSDATPIFEKKKTFEIDVTEQNQINV